MTNSKEREARNWFLWRSLFMDTKSGYNLSFSIELGKKPP